MKTTKVAFVHYAYPPVVGGVEELVKVQAEELAENGFEVTVLAGTGRSDNPGVKLIRIPELRSLLNIDPGLKEKLYTEESYPPGLLELTDTIYRQITPGLEGVEVIIAHNIFSLAFNPAIGQALLRYKEAHPAVEIIAWTHDFELQQTSQGRGKKEFKNAALNDYLYKMNGKLHYVAISEFLKNNTFIGLLGFTPDKVTVIPNGIDAVNFMYFDPAIKDLSEKYGLLKADPLILLPSKILAHKNVDLCVRIVHELVKSGKNPVMVITAKYIPHDLQASKEYFDSIARLIQELGLQKNVIILPDVLPETSLRMVKDLYSLSDLVLYLSSYENFGLPLLEASLARTPLFCSPLPVFKEVAGDLVQYVDLHAEPRQIADQIVHYLQEDRTSRMFARVKHHFAMMSIFREKLLPLIGAITRDQA